MPNLDFLQTLAPFWLFLVNCVLGLVLVLVIVAILLVSIVAMDKAKGMMKFILSNAAKWKY